MLRSKADAWADRGRCWAPLPRPRDRPLATAQPSACPEIDCVRDLLPRRVIAAAERRARAIGLGADRVLICADAMTEDAYLTALAASVGTSYEPSTASRGPRRCRLLANAWVLLLTPFYWLLLSVAAWRALYQLLHDPQRWEKTEHGLARTSRLAEAERY